MRRQRLLTSSRDGLLASGYRRHSIQQVGNLIGIVAPALQVGADELGLFVLVQALEALVELAVEEVGKAVARLLHQGPLEGSSGAQVAAVGAAHEQFVGRLHDGGNGQLQLFLGRSDLLFVTQVVVEFIPELHSAPGYLLAWG